MKPAIAFCLDKKIGDSLVGLLFANQFAQSGFPVAIYSNVLHDLKNWLQPHFIQFSVSPNNIQDLQVLSKTYDVVVIYHYPDLANILSDAASLFPQFKNVVYFTPWGFSHPLPKADFSKFHNDILTQMEKLNGTCFAEKHFRPYQYIENLCKKIHLPVKDLIVPGRKPKNLDLLHTHFHKRIIIHPTSSTHKVCWAPKKFVLLANYLKEASFEPVFVLHTSEIEKWEREYLTGKFLSVSLSFSDLANFIYESGFSICNNSGIAHLSSFLQIPTLTINVNGSYVFKKWSPFFYKNTIVTHEKWMPNALHTCKTHRRTFISAKKVFNTFMKHQLN